MRTIIQTLGRICLLAVLCLTISGFAPLQQGTPESGDTTSAGEVSAAITQVDTSLFPTVTVYISVTDSNGEPAPISLDNIQLTENGVVITPDEIVGAGEIGPLSTMLVVDVSGSMNTADKLNAAKDAAIAYVEGARPSDRIGLLAFNTQVETVQPLTGDGQLLIEAIKSLTAQDDTAMYDALGLAIEQLAPVSGRKAVIVLTDGLDNRSKLSPQEVIAMIGPEGLSISTVGLGDPTQTTAAITSLNEPALQALAEQAGGAYGYANDVESLTALYEQLGRSLQSEYVITYTSPSSLRDGVNRSLSVALIGSNDVGDSLGASGAYNPGGLVPEVAQTASWGVFLALLGGLALLLLIPAAISMIAGRFRARNAPKRGKVKLSKAPANKSASPKVKLKN